MKVQTNTGEQVDLSQPENIRRGMVFRDERDGHTFLCVEHYSVREWQDGEGGRADIGYYTAHCQWRLVGCDPEHATRADCERFGIAPGIDAAAHGFARTADGFAVDLRRETVSGAVYRHGRITLGRDVESFGERFIGLDARHARPEDVERLRCGAPSGADGTPTINPTNGAWVQAQAPRCSLAIQHDGDHEDIATGVRWAALKFHEGPTTGGEVRFMVNGKTETVRYEQETTAEKMEAALRAAAERLKEMGQGCPNPDAHVCLVADTHVDTTRRDPIDGCAPTTGWTALLTRQDNPNENGYWWLFDSGWTKAITPPVGAIVKVTSGVCYEGTHWIRTSETEWMRYSARTEQPCPNTRCPTCERIPSAARGCPGCGEMGQPRPNTPSLKDGVRDYVREDGYGCEACVSAGLITVRIFGLLPRRYSDYCARLREWIKGRRPECGAIVVTAHDCPGCGCSGTCEWRENGKADPDAVVCETCQCRWCGPATPEFRARTARPRVTVHPFGMATLTGLNGAVSWHGDKVRVWTLEGREVPPEDYDVVRLSTEPIRFNVGDGGSPGTTAEGNFSFTLEDSAPLNLTPQALALRSALPSIDALPWSAADRRALHDDARAVAEAIEATDGKAPAGLREPPRSCSRRWRRPSTWGRRGAAHVLLDRAEFGRPVIGRCPSCGFEKPVAVTLLLTAESEAKNNGPWCVNEQGNWTKPEAGGTVDAVIEGGDR